MGCAPRDRTDDPLNEPFMLWTSNSDGSDPRVVGTQAGAFVDWSPDRRHLVFDFRDEAGRIQVGRINPDGTDFAKNGTEIVFIRVHESTGATALGVVSANGNGVGILRPFASLVEHPRWSPDGQTIIYNVETRSIPDPQRDGISSRRTSSRRGAMS